MHVVQVDDDWSIFVQVEVLCRNIDDETSLADFCCFHIPKMEPPYLSPLIVDKLGLG
jgi:hypothetical protein